MEKLAACRSPDPGAGLRPHAAIARHSPTKYAIHRETPAFDRAGAQAA